MEVLLIILGFLILAAWLVSIAYLCNAAKAKGWHENGAAGLWFVGIFCSPVILGLYAAALPDRKGQTDSKTAVDTQPPLTLPSI